MLSSPKTGTSLKVLCQYGFFLPELEVKQASMNSAGARSCCLSKRRAAVNHGSSPHAGPCSPAPTAPSAQQRPVDAWMPLRRLQLPGPSTGQPVCVPFMVCQHRLCFLTLYTAQNLQSKEKKVPAFHRVCLICFSPFLSHS